MFFDDILVPPHLLFPDTNFNADENVFVWKNEDTELFFDIGETVRFRVEAEEWVDQSPKGPPSKQGGGDEVDGEGVRKPPYSIVASMCEAGLGPVTWW